MSFWRRWVALAALLPVTAAGACAAPGPSAGSRPEVVVAFYPLQFVAEQIAGGDAAVANLTAPGAEPHDVELTARQVASLSRASLVVYERGFQPVVDEAVAQSGNDRVLDTTTVVPLEPLAAPPEHDVDGAPPGHDGDAQPSGHDGDAEPTGHEGGGHDNEAQSAGLDPHVWLDPNRLAAIARVVADRLAEIDPEHAAAYAANRDRLLQRLTDLDQAYRTGLQTCERTAFITSHAAFGYLARRYGLQQIAISGLSPEEEPSPARIAEVQREATSLGLTTIFYETLVSPAVSTSIARDLRLGTDVLDPVEGITPESRGTDYVAVMTANLEALRRAGGCS